MAPNEKRKFIRFDSLHLLDYQVIDEQGEACEYSMARTLDVSINGIKIETSQKIPLPSTLVITLGIEDTLVDIYGTPVYSDEVDGRVLSGVEFKKVNAQSRSVLRRYVDEFEARKKTLLQKGDIPQQRSPAV